MGKTEIDARDDDQRTLPARAVVYWHTGDIAQLLATGQVDVEARDKDHHTPLLLGVLHGGEVVVKQLLAAGKVDVDSRNQLQQTPLLRVTWARDETDINNLATNRIDVNARSHSDTTALSCAVLQMSDGIVKLLLDTGKVDVNSKLSSGFTPLATEAVYRYEMMIRHLLAMTKIDLDVKTKNLPKTAREMAIRQKYGSIIKTFHVSSETNYHTVHNSGRIE